MDFDYEELWEESRSEFDRLMDETIEKIKNLILGRAKDEVEDVLRRADEAEDKVKRLEEIIRNQDKKRKELEKEIAELKKRAEPNRFTYGIMAIFTLYSPLSMQNLTSSDDILSLLYKAIIFLSSTM